MGWWSDFTGATAKRNAARGLEKFNNEQADIFANKTRQQFGDMANQWAGQQADGLANVSAWLDPSMAFQMDNATNRVLGAYGNQGKLFSPVTMNALSNAQQNIANQGWQQALQNYMSQQGFNNQVQQQNFSNNFQTQSMINQADATKFNTAAQGRANVAAVQAPSAWDAAMGIGGIGLQGLGVAGSLGWKPLA